MFIISFFFSLILYSIIYLKINKSLEEIKIQYQTKNINLNLLNNSKQIEPENKTIVIDENKNKQIETINKQNNSNNQKMKI